MLFNVKVEVEVLFDPKVFNGQFHAETEAEAIAEAKDFYAQEMDTFIDEVRILECKPAFTFKEVPVDLFWSKVANGMNAPIHAFLILNDGTQAWGYTMNGFFDGHKQGLSFSNKDIRGVLIKTENL